MSNSGACIFLLDATSSSALSQVDRLIVNRHHTAQRPDACQLTPSTFFRSYVTIMDVHDRPTCHRRLGGCGGYCTISCNMSASMLLLHVVLYSTLGSGKTTVCEILAQLTRLLLTNNKLTTLPVTEEVQPADIKPSIVFCHRASLLFGICMSWCSIVDGYADDSHVHRSTPSAR